MEPRQGYVFLRSRHIKYLKRCLSVLPSSTVTYDTSRMTALFFGLSGLDVLGALEEIPQQQVEEMIEWIYSLQLTSKDGHRCGGFRGGHCITNVTKQTTCCSEGEHSSTSSGSNKQLAAQPDVNLHSPSTNGSHILEACGLDVRLKDPVTIPPKLLKLTQCSTPTPAAVSCSNSLPTSAALSSSAPQAELDTGHIAMTYTALATLVLLGDDLSRVDKPAVLRHVASLQCADGSFLSNSGGSENDLRFVYCASVICRLLGDSSVINVAAAVRYITNCIGYSGALGQGALQEGHGGSTYCGVAALHLLGALNNKDSAGSSCGGSAPAALQPCQEAALVRWLLMRQENITAHQSQEVNSCGGGLQGRPNKPADTCYTFWVGAALKLLGHEQLLEQASLLQFVLSTQDPVTGGLAKYSSAKADALHTYLGISGLAVLGLELGLREVDPALNITCRALDHLKSLQQRAQ